MPALLTPREAVSGARKAAVVIAALGEKASAELMKPLSEDQVQRLSQAVVQLGAVEPEEVEAILEEFCQLRASRAGLPRGGIEFTRRMLDNAFGPETGTKHLDRIHKTASARNGHVEALQKARSAAVGPAYSRRASPDHRPGAVAFEPAQGRPPCWRRCLRPCGRKSRSDSPSWIRFPPMS